MSKKILVLNRGVETDNFGDQAINYSLIKLLESEGAVVKSANFTALFTRKGSKIASVISNIKHMYLISSQKYDLVIIGGGELIQSNNYFPVSFFLWVLLLKTFSSNRITLFGIGVDKKYSFIKKILYKVGMCRISNIYVRDIRSKQNLKEVFRLSSIVIPDVVFALSNFYKPKQQNKNDYILFGITTYSSVKRYNYIVVNDEQDYLLQQAELLLSYAKTNKIILFYNTLSDYYYTLKFRKFLYIHFDYKVDIVKIQSLFAYINVVYNASKVISSRMHALIIASAYGVDAIPIIRNDKLKAFSEESSNYSIHEHIDKIRKAIKEVMSYL